jgi:hypothetical protein
MNAPTNETLKEVLSFSIVSDIDECERLWRQHVPQETLFDLWEYRVCFFDEKCHVPHFIVATRGERFVGMLPLWHDLRDESYEIFGDQLMINRLRLEKDLLGAFLEQLPMRTYLWWLDAQEHPAFVPGETRYLLDLEEYGYDMDEYLRKLDRKHRQNLNRDVRAFEVLGASVVQNRLEDYDRLIELSRARFQEDSFFSTPQFATGLRRVLEWAEREHKLRMLSIHVKGRCEAVMAAIEHGSHLHLLLGGNNLEFPSIGKIVIYEHLKAAAERRCRFVDFSTDDCGWKHRWNLLEHPLWEWVRK